MKVSQVKIITGTRIKKDVTPEVNAFLLDMAGTAEIVNIAHSSYYDSEAEDEVYSVLIHYKIEEEVLNELQEHKQAQHGDEGKTAADTTKATAKKHPSKSSKKTKAPGNDK